MYIGSNAGRDGIDAGATAMWDKMGGTTGMYSVMFVFFFLYSPLMFSPSSPFPIIYVLQKAGRTQSGAGHDRINAGHDSNTGQDKGAAEWEVEVEGRAGGLTRRVGGGGKRGRAGTEVM